MISKLSHRRAFTLVELATVTMIAGIVSSSCAMVLRQAYLVHRNSLRTVARLRSLDSLRVRWSADVQSAVSARAGDSLELQLADGSSVAYVINGQSIERQKLIEDRIIARNSWIFAEPLKYQWAIDASQPTSLVVLELSPTQSSAEQSPWKFFARLGVMYMPTSNGGESR